MRRPVVLVLVWVLVGMLLVATGLGLALRSSIGNERTDQQRLWAIASLLHAPGDTTTQTVATSTVPAAWKMRAQIQELLSQGESNQTVLATIEAEYGPSSLADPSASGFGVFVWVLPVLFLAILALGLVVALVWLPRRRSARSERVAAEGGDGSVNVLPEDWRQYL
ncbi:MAG: cytochrome c-type biogenesis protein CcmH [Firmicutes bacterium]|nr:cytochrome c-type biogenesis protein CcmH [Bacillota bacterium]